MESTNPDAVFEEAERLALEAVQNPQKIVAYRSATDAAKALEGGRGWKGNRMRKNQAERMIDYIREKGYITQRTAALDLGVQSFTRRISDIREMGYVLRLEPRTNPSTGAEYNRYYIDAEPGAA